MSGRFYHSEYSYKKMKVFNLPRLFSTIIKSQRGQSLVEFALLLPVFLLLLLGIIQFGVIFSGYITATSAVREGARVAIVGAGDLEIRNKVIEMTASSPFLNEVVSGNIDIDPEEGSRLQMKPVSVELDASVKIIVPFLNYLVGENFDVFSKAVMCVEYIEGS